MKKFLFLLSAALLAMSMNAAPVDQATAMKKAQSYLKNKLYAGKIMAPEATNPVLLKTVMSDAKVKQPVLYIYNTSTTFLVIAGDDRAEEILMIGDRPLRDINNLAPGMIDILNQYKAEITFLQENPDLKVDPIPSPENTPSLRANTYGPLLTAIWDQEEPFWNQCKFTYGSTTYQCLTGCPATSASMVLYYWKYPTTQIPAMSSYTAMLELSYWNSVSNFQYPALPATTFDWANMRDDYKGNYSTDQGNAVATLMRYVGQAETMMYGTSAAGGSGIYTTDTQNVVDMFTLFGYDETTCRVVQKQNLSSGATNYTDAQWATLIQTEMAEGRPIVYMAVSSNGGGHAFNVDGYDSSTNKYHVNFGWSGDGNNWYAINSFSSGGYTFNQQPQAVIGIQPPSGPALETYNPVMLPADEAYITKSSFRADWTDATPDENVASYTLEVNPKPEYELLHSLYGSDFTGSQYYDITLPAPWGGTNVRGGNSSIIYFRNNYQGANSPGNITYTVPAGYSNATFTMTITTGSSSDGAGNLAVGTPSTASVNHNFSAGSSYSWLVTASAGEKITITTTDANYSPDIASIIVYAGDANTGSNANTLTFTGITEKNYTVTGLDEGTYLYRVKATYVNDRVSDWSNVEEVTLFDSTPAFVRGDVTGDHNVDMDDLALLINYLLDDATTINQMGAASCNAIDDTTVDMDDLAALINFLLTNEWAN